MTRVQRTFIAGIAALVAWPAMLRAQGEPLPVQLGPVAGISWTQQRVEVNDDPSFERNGMAVYVGLRLAPMALFPRCNSSSVCRRLARLLVTGHVTIGATHFRGIEGGTGDAGFAFVDPLGLKLAYPITNRLRLAGVTRSGRRTIELDQDDDVANYWGDGGRARGVGIEVVLTKSGRGLEIMWLQLDGRFDNVESLSADGAEQWTRSADWRYRASVLLVGWSGPFTGISLPWR